MQPDDDGVLITVALTRAQAVRLETLIGDIRRADPGIDDNAITDALFETGMAWFENNLKNGVPA